MRAVVVTEAGGPEALTVSEIPDPEPGPGEVLVRVAATAINRADLIQRKGNYPPPPGAPETLGLECSGTVAALGEGVEGWSVGDEVCALLAGGGYAELVAVPAGQLMTLPPGVDLVTAAALPEVACTVWSNVSMIARLAPHETFLVHGGAGGIGTFAIQLVKALGATVATTAGSEAKLEICRELGADIAVNYREQDYVAAVKEATDGHGADVVLDNMGGLYFARNIEVLAPGGRVVVIGLQGGTKGEVDVGMLWRKRGSVFATALRTRPTEEKAAICAAVVEHVWPFVGEGRVRPIVHTRLPLEDAAEAHALMEASDNVGKILLTA
jgi:putative PIG3 family NAD(P)H quinone oxidoreductase